MRDGYVVYDQYTKATHHSCTVHILRRCHQWKRTCPPPTPKSPRPRRSSKTPSSPGRFPLPPSGPAAAGKCRARLGALCAPPTSCDANRRLLKHLAHQADALFSFLTIEGIDATIFRGEQAVRPCFVNRKTWSGNRTWTGTGTQGILTSIIGTAAKAGIDAVDYLANRARAPDPDWPSASAELPGRAHTRNIQRRIQPSNPSLNAPRNAIDKNATSPTRSGSFAVRTGREPPGQPGDGQQAGVAESGVALEPRSSCR